MRYKPPKNTVPTTIYDAYGRSIVVWFPKNDKVGPKSFEAGICQAQISHKSRNGRILWPETKQ